ncbi:MAG: hypothetical protein ACM3OB_02910 [Acidobacteriota bacterium]
MSGLQLVPLACPSCGAGVEAGAADVVYYCSACRNGYLYGDRTTPLRPVDVAFVTVPGKAISTYLPFWLLPATVRILARPTSGGAGVMRALFGGGEPVPGAESQGIFALPAYDLPLGSLLALAQRYTQALPTLGERLGERLRGGRLTVEDAQKLAEYVLIADEAQKPDTLTGLRYELRFGPPRLLGVPFVLTPAGGRVDALFGLAG